MKHGIRRDITVQPFGCVKLTSCMPFAGPVMRCLPALLFLLSLLPTSRAETLDAYCDHWEDFCNQDGSGIYLDLLRAVYGSDMGVTPHIVPYKRAIALTRSGVLAVLLGSYRNEVDTLHYASQPDGVDLITVYMTRDKAALWQGIDQLKRGRLLLQKGWSRDETLGIEGSYTEVESADKGFALLTKGRYDYFVTDSLPSNRVLPPIIAKKLQGEPTYPAFTATPSGAKALSLWELRMPRLIASGQVARIYEHYGRLAEFNGYLLPLYRETKQ